MVKMILILLVPASFLLMTATGDPRAEILELICKHELDKNFTAYVINSVATMESRNFQVQSSQFPKAVTGTGARAVIPQCFPAVGGRIFLDGCFMRGESYDFYAEYQGPEDKAVCANKTRKDQAYHDAVKDAVMQAAANAPFNQGYSKAEVTVKGVMNESVYVLANCWESVSFTNCQACLEKATSLILGCSSSTEGRALNTGIATGVYLWKLRTIRKRRRGSSDLQELLKILHDSSLNFKYSTLEKATQSFAEENKLGQGGFGTVYKGTLPDGGKLQSRGFTTITSRVADFYNEVNIISTLEHKNLVRLLGCSCTGQESLPVYEYLPNQSLDRFIFDPSRGKTLNWRKRYYIIVGTAEGLTYLHENTSVRIIHRDIKAINILLDAKFRAKIADFELTRSFQEDKSHISTAVAGTLGYMAPEYLAHGQLIEKVDIYSFGVVLLEMATGRPNNSGLTVDNLDSIVTLGSLSCLDLLVWKHFQKGTTEDLLDPNLLSERDEEGNIQDEVIRVIHIGLLCVQESPTLRPPMPPVLDMLKNKYVVLPPPTHPPFTDETSMELNVIGENPHLLSQQCL
ncbi:Cysteine-rich receptor-like protein [Drosera capensis]